MGRLARALAAGGLLLAALAASCGDARREEPAPALPAPAADQPPPAPPTDARTPTPDPTATPRPAPPAASPPPAPPTTFGDGTFRVGVDVPPDVYRAATPTDACEWARLDGSGEVTGWGSPRFPMTIVQLGDADAEFTGSGCGTWTNDRTPLVAPGQPFGDGAWFVGAEVAPGRWRATAPTDECRWWRLHGFGEAYGTGFPRERWGDTRPNVAGRAGFAIVDILPSDRAFVSLDCGTWTGDLTPIVTPGEVFGDGDWLVGIEIAPGRYYATEPESCLWYRLDGFGGEHYGRNALGGGRIHRGASFYRIADIAPGDTGFHSRGCGTWSRELTPIVAPGEPFGAGGFVVGPEIAPGRYRTSSPGERCFWMRLARFEGSTWDLPLAAYSDAGAVGVGFFAIVDIEPSDAGFFSVGCGTWTDDLTPIATPGRLDQLLEPPPAQFFGDGTWLVGQDVAPGRYRQVARPESCIWLRLDGFGNIRPYAADGSPDGDLDADVIDGGQAENPWDIVEIAASDAGFYSRGCHPWTPFP